MAADLDALYLDQLVRALAERLRPVFEQLLGRRVDDTLARSLAFVVLSVKVRFELSEEEALGCLTDGAHDFGVDAMLIEDVGKNETVVVLFQCKYHHTLEAHPAFPQDGVEKAAQAARLLLDASASLILNPRLRAKVADVHARAHRGRRVTRLTVVLCSNGREWEPPVQRILDSSRFAASVRFEYLDRKELVARLITPPPIDDTLQLIGKSVLDDSHGMRAVYAMVPALEIARLMKAHGAHLLDRNVRRYLGVSGYDVNREIRATLEDPARRRVFHILNNGLTFICSGLFYDTLQSEHHKVHVEGLQLINGAQTSQSIQQVLEREPQPLAWRDTQVQVRLYELSRKDDLVSSIVRTSNHQIPIEIPDLRSDDAGLRRMQAALEVLGYRLHRQRSDAAFEERDLSVLEAVSAVAATWLELPHAVTYGIQASFDSLFEAVFQRDVNGAQMALAAQLFQLARTRCEYGASHSPLLVRRGGAWVAMLMARQLLAELQLARADLDHRNFERCHQHVAAHGVRYFEAGVIQLRAGVRRLYGDDLFDAEETISLLCSTTLRNVL